MMRVTDDNDWRIRALNVIPVPAPYRDTGEAGMEGWISLGSGYRQTSEI